MMSDTCGPTLGMPFTRYDPATQSWRTSQDTSLWDLPMSSPTLPKSGSMRSGELTERPTLEPHTAENECSSLPTPHAGLGERGRDGVILNPKGQQDLQHTIATLLPTPLTTDYNTPASEWTPDRERMQLRDIATLLPTPTVMDMGSNYTPQEWEAWKGKQRAAHNNGNGHGASLTQELIGVSTSRLLPVGNDSPDQPQTPHINEQDETG